MQLRHLHKGINSGDDAATSCKNLVNFGAVVPEITLLICVQVFVWLLGEIRPTIYIYRGGISRRVGRWKCRWARLKWRWTCTSHINLVSFYPVLLQLQQASIRSQCFATTRYGAKLLCRAGYMLRFATHFC